jgi:hypothetical protein
MEEEKKIESEGIVSIVSFRRISLIVNESNRALWDRAGNPVL